MRLRQITRLFLFLIFSSVTLEIYAQEFNHFELNDKTALGESGGGTGELDPNDIRNFSPIYSQIINKYSSTYQGISDRLNDENLPGFFGGPNMIGWRHMGDFSTFQIIFKRSAAPAINGDLVIVNDEIIIEIDASTLIGELAENEVIDITEENKKAFAGLKYQRRLRYNHFSDTVMNGLQMHPEKLFFMFKYFNIDNFHKLNEYDYLLKEDSFTLGAGGIFTSPINQYLSIGAGALLEFEKKSKVSIQKLGVDDIKEDFEVGRISIENSSSRKASANISVILDFFKLLNMTLFRYDYSYEYSKTNKDYFSLYTSDLESHHKMNEFKKALSFKDFNYAILKDNIKTKELREKETRNSKYLAFIFGGLKESETERREIVKDGVLTRFFSHNYTKLNYKENFFSKIMNLFLGKLFFAGSIVNKTDLVEDRLSLDYNAEVNLIDLKEDYDISQGNIFSMNFQHEDNVFEGSRKKSKDIESKLYELISKRTSTISKYDKLFNEFKLQAPSTFYSKYSFDEDNIAHFMSLNESKLPGLFKDVCKKKNKSFFKKLHSLFSSCRHRLNKSYTTFFKEWTTEDYDKSVYKKCRRSSRRRYRSLSRRRIALNKCMQLSSLKSEPNKKKELPLWRLKDFLNSVAEHFDNKEHYKTIFGEFSRQGYVKTTANGFPFKDYFNEGKSKESVLTQFEIKNGLRAPAQID